MSSKSSFDECSFLITCHCSCLPYIKIWLVGFVRYLNHTRHVMNGQGLQLSCSIIPKSGNCGGYKKNPCNFRHLNTEIHEGNPWLISTPLWVSSNSFAVTSAKCVQVGNQSNQGNFLLENLVNKTAQIVLCLWSIAGHSVSPITFICNRFISSERSSLNISLHCFLTSLGLKFATRWVYYYLIYSQQSGCNRQQLVLWKSYFPCYKNIILPS